MTLSEKQLSEKRARRRQYYQKYYRKKLKLEQRALVTREEKLQLSVIQQGNLLLWRELGIYNPKVEVL